MQDFKPIRLAELNALSITSMGKAIGRCNLGVLATILTVAALFASSSLVFAEHDFTIKGQFTYTAQGVVMPVEGAIVGIMRDKSWAADPIVAEVRTAPDGTFSTQVKAKDVDTYYAKLFLNDKQGVFLHDWWTLNVREYNSATRGKNKTDLIDLGGTNIFRDGGRGTPQCAIWQGGRRAWQEYVAATGQRPLIGEHGNYQITMESTASGIVWTSRDTTHWEMNYGTGEFSNGVSPVSNPASLSYADLFQLYGTNLHEFGHALRHTADGSDNHFNWDATRFFYGHAHLLCDSSPTGVRDNAGYGFNEGWADYWQGTAIGVLRNCIKNGVSSNNFDQESAVALDLDALQDALGSCAGIPSNVHGDQLTARQRALMFLTLSEAGHEKIHSENDFREAWSRRFPSCTLPEAGAGLSAPVAIPPSVARRPLATPVLGDPRFATAHAKAESLPGDIETANIAVRSISPSLSRELRTEILTRPVLLRGELAYAQLLAAHLSAATAHPPSPAFLMTAEGERQREAEVAQFDSDARKIALSMLNDERAALVDNDKTDFADDIAMLDAQIASVQSGVDTVSSHMLGVVGGAASDSVSAKLLTTFR